MQREVRLRMLIFLTCLRFYLCIWRHVLILMTLIIVFLMFMFFLLQDFKDIFPDEIPSGLSPIQGIEHQIDIVLETSLPNRLTYRSNLDEINEL